MAFELGTESPESLLSVNPRPKGFAHGYELSHMLVPLGMNDRAPHGCGVFAEHHLRPMTYWYTCVHFDRVGRRCMNYEGRPRMCRQYPYGHSCLYKGCTQRGGVGTDDAPLPRPFANTCPACRWHGADHARGNALEPLRRCRLCRSTGRVPDPRRRRVWAALMRRLDRTRTVAPALTESRPAGDGEEPEASP